MYAVVNQIRADQDQVWLQVLSHDIRHVNRQQTQNPLFRGTRSRVTMLDRGYAKN